MSYPCGTVSLTYLVTYINSPIAIEHCDDVSLKMNPSAQPQRGPSGVGKQTSSQPPLLLLQMFVVPVAEVEIKQTYNSYVIIKIQQCKCAQMATIQNDIKINKRKTKYLVIDFSKTRTNFPTIRIHETDIQRVTKAKILGITVTSNLTWDVHVDEIT